MILAIVGGRDYDNWNQFHSILIDWIHKYGPIFEIVSGGARGADAMAQTYALRHGIKFICFPALWNRFGKDAGFRRNKQIVDYCEAMIAFPGGHGTQSSIDLAKKKDVILWEV